MLEFIAGIGAVVVSLFGVGTLTYTATPLATQPASAIIAQATPEPTEAQTEAPAKILNPPPSTAPAVVQYITQPVIERELLAQNTITREDLDASLAALRSDLLFVIANSLPKAYTFTYPAAAAPVSTATFAHSQKIDQLANVTISNAIVSGVAGLTDADIPDAITASNYLALSGGTVTGDFTLTGNFTLSGTQMLSGALTVPYVTATSSTASSFVQASTTRLSVFDRAYFGGTATTTIESTGAITVTSTSANTFPYASTTVITASGTGYFGLGAFTSTSGTTTIASGQGFTVGGSQFVLQQGSGKVGIGTISPTYLLSIESGTSGFTTGWNRTSGATAGLYADLSKAGVGTVSAHDLVFFTGSAAPQVTLQVSTGNLGIGTTSPTNKLEVAGNTFLGGNLTATGTVSLSANGNALGLGDGSFASNYVGFSGARSLVGFDITFNGTVLQGTSGKGVQLNVNDATFGGTDGAALTIPGTGSNLGYVGIGTTSPWRKLSVTGTVGFDGLTSSTGAGSLCLTANREVVYNSASDACLPSLRETKHDISSLSLDALEMVDALDPVSFVYNDSDGRVRYGFIAEDTASVDPHLVTYSASGTLSGIDDRSIISIVVKAIKELRDKVDALVATVAGFADRITTKELCVEDVCVTRDQFLKIVQNTNQSPAPSEVEEDAPDTEAPVIAINGNNPAHLQVGDTYNDLGATVTDNVDLNLGYRTFVGSTLFDQAQIDTSELNEWHIHYVATDNAGNTATSTRTVIVESPSIIPSDAPVDEPEDEATEEPEPEEVPSAS